MKFMNLSKWQHNEKMEEVVSAEAGGAGGGAVIPEAAPPAEPAPVADPATPPADPETPPVEEPAAEPSIEDQLADKPNAEDLYEGSEFFEAATHTFDKAEIDGQVVVDYFQEHGEFAPEHLALMQERMGKAEAQILINGIKGEIAAQAAEEQATVQAVYDAVGGEEQFKEVAAWAASEESGFDQQERDDMNGLLAQGGNVSKWAAQLLMIGFQNAGGQQPAGAAQLQQGGHAPQPKGIEPISQQDYRKAIQSARSQGEYDAINKRATYTMGLSNAAEYGFKYH